MSINIITDNVIHIFLFLILISLLDKNCSSFTIPKRSKKQKTKNELQKFKY